VVDGVAATHSDLVMMDTAVGPLDLVVADAAVALLPLTASTAVPVRHKVLVRQTIATTTLAMCAFLETRLRRVTSKLHLKIYTSQILGIPVSLLAIHLIPTIR
jgi:hypothetical protein